jgi:Recombination endonuclease VII
MSETRKCKGVKSRNISCGRELPFTDKFFAKDFRLKNGLKGSCIECTNKSITAWAKDNPEKRYTSKSKSYFIRKYGITFEEYEFRRFKQNYRCFICRTPEPEDRKLAVDHCHKTNVVRDLLCSGCNTMLGNIEKQEDPIGFLDRIKDYLVRHATTLSSKSS